MHKGRRTGQRTGPRRYDQGEFAPHHAHDFEGSSSDAFRMHVLRLRHVSDAPSVAVEVAGLRTALIAAASKDTDVDHGLLGMAASQCVRHRQPELMRLICAHATFRLGRYQGRSVAELASAAAKLGCIETGFGRAVSIWCVEPPQGAFTGVRDVAMLLNALRLFQDIDVVGAFGGLAQVVLSHLNDKVLVRDLAELAHPLAHTFGPKSRGGDLPPPVKEALIAVFVLFRRALHLANARDVTMVAGSIAASWLVLEAERETVMRTCLCDIAQMTRFRRTEFNSQDLSQLAVAFAKADMPSPELADVLSDPNAIHLTKFACKDLALLLWAAARLTTWSTEKFAKAVASEVENRDLTKFSAHDLCSSAQSLAKLGETGREPLRRIADEAFSRQLCQFACTDKAILLWALAKAHSTQPALVRLLARSLAVEGCDSLERDLASAVLWAMARLWTQLLPEDTLPHKLFASLCAVCPWVGATSFEVCNGAWAMGQVPVQIFPDVWASLLSTLASLSFESCSAHELSCLLSGLAACPDACGEQLDEVKHRAIGEVTRLFELDRTQFSDYDSQLLAGAFSRASWPLPAELDGILNETIPKKITSGNHGIRPESRSSSASSPFIADWDEDEEDSTRIEPAALVEPPYPKSLPATLKLVDTRKGTPLMLFSSLQKCWADVNEDDEDNDPGQGHGAMRSVGQGHNELGHGHGYGHGQGSREGRGHSHSFGSCAECGTPGWHSPLVGPKSPHRALIPPPMDGDSYETTICPAIGAAILDPENHGEVRLNNNCDFDGHCIQLKNTFLHVTCAHNDFETENDCLVCRMNRSRSCDAPGPRSSSPDPPRFWQPADLSHLSMLGKPATSCVMMQSGEPRSRRDHWEHWHSKPNVPSDSKSSGHDEQF